MSRSRWIGLIALAAHSQQLREVRVNPKDGLPYVWIPAGLVEKRNPEVATRDSEPQRSSQRLVDVPYNRDGPPQCDRPCLLFRCEAAPAEVSISKEAGTGPTTSNGKYA
jgi:hypothetical protein